MKKFIWVIVGLVVVIAIISGVVMNVNKTDAKQTLLFKKDEFKSGELSSSWESFRKEQELSKRDAKITDFDVVLDNNKNIYSIKFTVLDKLEGDSYRALDYQKCFSCETKQENKLNVSSEDLSKKPGGYNKLMNADEFFSKLDTLEKQNFFTQKDYKYVSIHSDGAYKGTGYDGSYFVLDGNDLKEIQKSNDPDKKYVGYNVQVISTNDPENYGSNADSTKTAIISDYKE